MSPSPQPQNIAFNEQHVYENMTQRLRQQIWKKKKKQSKDFFDPMLVSIKHLQVLAQATFEYLQTELSSEPTSQKCYLTARLVRH
jgi:hypothetical protein